MIPRFSPDNRWGDLGAAFLPARKNAIRLLEEQMALYSQQEEAIFFRYGRSGLYFLLKALGYRNKKVVLPSYTCVVVAHAIVLSGNIPVFLDNSEGNIQPSAEDYLSAIDPDVGMIIPTHLFGIAQETEELYRTIKALHPQVFVLQDCAHSFFCQDRRGKLVTSSGDGALFGMNISKLVNSVKGGCLTLQDPKLAKEVRRIFQLEQTAGSGLHSRSYLLAASMAFTRPGYELVSWLSRNTGMLNSELKYFSSEKIDLPVDFACPPGDFEAEIGLRSLSRFGDRIKRRAELADVYIELLKSYRDQLVYLPEFSSGNTWSHFPILIDRSRRNSFALALEQNLKCEIGKIVDYSVADLVAYQQLGHKGKPRAVEAAEQVLNLPLTLFEGLTPLASARRIVNAVEKCFQYHGLPGRQLKLAPSA